MSYTFRRSFTKQRAKRRDEVVGNWLGSVPEANEEHQMDTFRRHSQNDAYSSILQGKTPKGLKLQRSLDAYSESNEGKTNIRQIQDESLECVSSKNNEEILDDEVEEKTPLKKKEEKDTSANNFPAARSISLIEPGPVIYT